MCSSISRNRFQKFFYFFIWLEFFISKIFFLKTRKNVGFTEEVTLSRFLKKLLKCSNPWDSSLHVSSHRVTSHLVSSRHISSRLDPTVFKRTGFKELEMELICFREIIFEPVILKGVSFFICFIFYILCFLLFLLSDLSTGDLSWWSFRRVTLTLTPASVSCFPKIPYTFLKYIFKHLF